MTFNRLNGDASDARKTGHWVVSRREIIVRTGQRLSHVTSVRSVLMHGTEYEYTLKSTEMKRDNTCNGVYTYLHAPLCA